MLALLDHLDVPCELKQAPVGQFPDGLERWSPSGRIPLLVHGEVVIGESRVMLEYLSEAYEFEAAYPAGLSERTRHRYAMALMDGFLAPALATGGALEVARLGECLDVIEDAALAAPDVPCLLTMHLGPLWLRFQWWRPEWEVTRAIRGRTKLVAWLDAAASVDAVVRTAPSRSAHVAEFRAVLASTGATKR